MLYILSVILLFLITVTFHEVAHGWAAYLLGDDTAKRSGRLTLNPIKHLDWFWTILFPAMLFFATGGRFAIGAAKPVPVDFLKLKVPKRDMMVVALAGPMANLFLAACFSICLKYTGYVIFLYAAWFNIGLAVFNLIPIPPLDGSKVLAGLLPGMWAYRLLLFERYGFALILVLYFTGLLRNLVLPGINFFCYVLRIPGLYLGGG